MNKAYFTRILNEYLSFLRKREKIEEVRSNENDQEKK